MKDACLFHIKGTTSLLICYPLRVPVMNVVLHRPLRRAVDVNDLKFFNIEFFEQRLSFITRTIISRVSWVMSKENLSLVNSKLQPRGYIKKKVF